jgi:hydroxyacylglutathione hydrolase
VIKDLKLKPKIFPINLKVPCYLIRDTDDFILIDTGDSSDRDRLENELDLLNVSSQSFKLVILTHGDFDHAGNAAFLRKKYGVKIAMHASDSGMVEKGDMGFNRKLRSDRVSVFGRIIMFISSHFVPPTQFEVFKPDHLIKDGQDLTEFGFDAKILELPGHSKGSIGVLTGNGDLFCGDLLMNMLKPNPHFVIDDYADFTCSIEKLKKLCIQTVYPGHGKPFSFKQYIKNHR